MEANTPYPEGVPMRHAYSITKIVRAEIKTGLIQLIRIRNPWGNRWDILDTVTNLPIPTEWRGAWSDKSKEWQDISEEERESLGLTVESDGEFFMSLQDFMKYFHRGTIQK